jgi:hypothetical protein
LYFSPSTLTSSYRFDSLRETKYFVGEQIDINHLDDLFRILCHHLYLWKTPNLNMVNFDSLKKTIAENNIVAVSDSDLYTIYQYFHYGTEGDLDMINLCKLKFHMDGFFDTQDTLRAGLAGVDQNVPLTKQVSAGLHRTAGGSTSSSSVSSSTGSTGGGMYRDDLRRLMQQNGIYDPEISEQLLWAFDLNGDGIIDANEYMQALDIMREMGGNDF